ncbi:hypothetical protein BN1723_010032 [Verticillium longisporum]|uniref:Condensation domain-containing protein n=1 Tax=Verticillium longisporum TaxID=100787 RepID=A0A0G4KUH4_VERLO|nr:hypothetical protein BN1723_010032 [Verticillium longisporum]
MSTTQRSLAWAEVAPGIWHRDIDEVETFWAQAARAHDTQGRRPFAITGHASLQINRVPSSSHRDLSSSLREAWCRIRHDHPSVASEVDYDFATERFTRSYHTLQNDAEREAWLSLTFVEISNGQTGPADPFRIKPPSRGDSSDYRDIVFRARHDTIDGVGTLLLLNNLLEHASRIVEQDVKDGIPEFNGTEAQNLSPSYRAAAGVPQQFTPALQKRVAQMTAEHVAFSKTRAPESKHYLSPPYVHGAQSPGRHQRTDITLDSQTSANILAACKTLGATVTHAVNAVIPIVLRDFVPEDAKKETFYFRWDLLRNLRPFCAAPYNSSKHPVTAYHSGSCFACDLVIPSKTDEKSSKDDFEHVLQEIRALYRRVADDTEHGLLAPTVWTGWLQTLPKVEKNPALGPPPSPTPGVTLSSLGRVDGMLPSKIGQLNLAAAYNDAWQTEEAAQNFLKACLRSLSTALGVEI